MSDTTTSPAPAAAAQPSEPTVASLPALSEVINMMAEDKSNDWAEEIATLTEVETELIAARADLETYRANVGRLENIVTTSRYARLGAIVAVTIGSERDLNLGDEMINDFSDSATVIGLPNPGAIENLEHYRKLADAAGIQYEPDEDEESDEEHDDSEDTNPNTEAAAAPVG